jgi:hypothetical protein
MNSYELSRNWFDWSFSNPELISPNHSALYFFIIEHCNRLGWKEKFGLPTTMAKEAIGIRSYNTYIKTLNDLVEFGFIKMIEKSKNQYSSNIIALSNFDKALDKALDKAMIKHTTKQSESTSSIIKHITKNIIGLSEAKEKNLNNWINYRKEIKKKLSEASINNLRKIIADKSDECVEYVIQESITNGWQGLFWDNYKLKPLVNKSVDDLYAENVMKQYEENLRRNDTTGRT